LISEIGVSAKTHFALLLVILDVLSEGTDRKQAQCEKKPSRSIHGKKFSSSPFVGAGGDETSGVHSLGVINRLPRVRRAIQIINKPKNVNHAISLRRLREEAGLMKDSGLSVTLAKDDCGEWADGRGMNCFEAES
jgi:hypothetical protein